MQSASPITSLRAEHTLLAALSEVLKQEQQHLVVADIDGLQAVTTEKSALVRQLAALAGERHGALEAAGFEAGENGMAAWLGAAAEADPAARSLWQDVLVRTRDAKELNRLNGMLINRHMGHTQSALAALRPPTQASNSFYGPSGIATTKSTSRSFIAG